MAMALQQRMPLMVSTIYGSLDMMRLIVAAWPAVDVNRSCFPDGSTTLHCAASGGSLDAVEAVRRLLAAGADVTADDSGGYRPLDVVVSLPKLQSQKLALSNLLIVSVNALDFFWVILGFMVFRWELPIVENSILALTANDLRREIHPTINPEKVKAATEGLAHITTADSGKRALDLLGLGKKNSSTSSSNSKQRKTRRCLSRSVPCLHFPLKMSQQQEVLRIWMCLQALLRLASFRDQHGMKTYMHRAARRGMLLRWSQSMP